jgi:NIPSNAP
VKHLSIFITSLLFSLFASTTIADSAPSTVYELRTYTTNEGKLPNLNARFRDHTIKLFEKHGMENIVYWTPTKGENTANTLIYIIAHESRDAAKTNWENFGNDPEWKKVAKESQLDGKILAKSPHSVFMSKADLPLADIKNSSKKRLYSLRQYTTFPGRLPDLLQRFRGGTLDLFSKHNMADSMYFIPSDMKDTLIYFIAHKNEESAKRSWKEFRADPEWKVVRDESTKNGKIVKKVKTQVLASTRYSPLK